MKIVMMALLLCVSGVALGQDAKPIQQTDSKFDGTWQVTLIVPDHTDANGAKALGFTFYFTAKVKGGLLHGEYRSKDNPPWLSIDGKIGPDGAALFNANGITGKPAYNLQNIAAGIPYAYHVKARFEGGNGTGARVENRVANFTFVKQ